MHTPLARDLWTLLSAPVLPAVIGVILGVFEGRIFDRDRDGPVHWGAIISLAVLVFSSIYFLYLQCRKSGWLAHASYQVQLITLWGAYVFSWTVSYNYFFDDLFFVSGAWWLSSALIGSLIITLIDARRRVIVSVDRKALSNDSVQASLSGGNYSGGWKNICTVSLLSVLAGSAVALGEVHVFAASGVTPIATLVMLIALSALLALRDHDGRTWSIHLGFQLQLLCLWATYLYVYSTSAGGISQDHLSIYTGWWVSVALAGSLTIQINYYRRLLRVRDRGS
jgi:hypothetical protein